MKMNNSVKKTEIREILIKSLSLQDDWDGDEGHAPDKIDVDNAINFLDNMPEFFTEICEVIIIGDGEINFDWEKSGINLEIGFSDNEISYFGKSKDEIKFKGTHDFKNDTIPKKLQIFFDLYSSKQTTIKE